MLATIKSGEAAARRDYRMQLVAERLSGRPQDDDYVNAAMQRGIELEPMARSAFELLTGKVVRECGFLAHSSLMAGCSLDGYLGDFEELVSLKCPKTATHLGYWRAGIMPAAYVPQMLAECWITGARRYHFVSYDDRLPDGLQAFHTVRLVTDAEVEGFERSALAFLAEVDRECGELEAMVLADADKVVTA